MKMNCFARETIRDLGISRWMVMVIKSKSVGIGGVKIVRFWRVVEYKRWRSSVVAKVWWALNLKLWLGILQIFLCSFSLIIGKENRKGQGGILSTWSGHRKLGLTSLCSVWLMLFWFSFYGPNESCLFQSCMVYSLSWMTLRRDMWVGCWIDAAI